MKKRICLLLAVCVLLSGCVTPQVPKGKCTVVFEDNGALLFPAQVYEITRFSELAVRIGIPKGQRIASVSYENYSLSSKESESENYAYYTLTLHQVRYDSLVRITTAPAYTTAYHAGEGRGESIAVTEESPHLYFNTLPWRQQFTREGYRAIGWNTKADGTGREIGFGSRFDHRASSHTDLYVRWVAESAGEAFTYEIKDGGAIITGYRGQGDLVIPEVLGGKPVTAIGAGAFRDLETELAVLPSTLLNIEEGAFDRARIGKLYLFDSLLTVSQDSFRNCELEQLHIQAVTAPVYSGSYFDTFADKMDYLDSLKDKKKLVLFCGSSARFGYDSNLLEEAFPNYRVVNMGVFAYANMLPQARIVQQRMAAGDVLLSSPELDSIPMQFCGETDLDKETFCMMESNYDLFASLDCREFTNIFGALGAYLTSRRGMEGRDYTVSAWDYDEDGNPTLTPSYNLQGDYILYRPNNEEGKLFGVKRAYYNVSHIRNQDIEGLNRIYDDLTQMGVKVLFTWSPRSRISISRDSTPETIAALDAFLRENLHARMISRAEDSLMDPYYFYGTDNHLSTDGVALYTQMVIGYLKDVIS